MTVLALHAGDGSIVLEPVAGSAPVWRHCGAKVVPGDLPSLTATRTPASYSLDQDCPLSTAPVSGQGWFGPAVVALRRDGEALPLVWTSAHVDNEPDAIRIAVSDDVSGISLIQTIRLDADAGWRIGAQVINRGEATVSLDALASVILPLPPGAARIVSWRGRHNAELVEADEALPEAIWQRETRRGLSGHGGAPGVYVLGDGALALQLCWSGDSRIAIERDDEGYHILSAMAVLQPGEVVLAPDDSWTAPDALLAIGHDRNAAMAAQHAMVRKMLHWPGGAMRPRKVHLNSWEACYFDHDATRILELARAAADIGIERFVLDDGWFKGRNDDTAGLGDWTPDPVKYPNGLKPLADAVRALGMEFGLWVEPEMVNPDSDLYRAHPEWALHQAGAPMLTARGQLVLDMRLPAVREYLFAALDTVLRDVPIGYLKWDHNRDLVPAGGAAQVHGTYELLARLRAAHPEVEIESCAGGGGRSDAGMVPYVHRFWTSDNIDAVSRVTMQRGFLAFLPPEMMGSHVGASPAHATGRSQTLAFRAAVASAGHFGVELDPDALKPVDRADLAQWIAFARSARDLVHGGGIWLGEGADGLVWQAQGAPDSGLLLWVIRTAPALDRRPRPLRLSFLAGHGALDVRLLGIAGGAGHAAHVPALWAQSGPVSFAADWLAQAGLPMPPLRAESVAVFHIARGGHVADRLAPFPS